MNMNWESQDMIRILYSSNWFPVKRTFPCEEVWSFCLSLDTYQVKQYFKYYYKILYIFESLELKVADLLQLIKRKLKVIFLKKPKWNNEQYQ